MKICNYYYESHRLGEARFASPHARDVGAWRYSHHDSAHDYDFCAMLVTGTVVNTVHARHCEDRFFATWQSRTVMSALNCDK
jgi:hypothetical protein